MASKKKKKFYQKPKSTEAAEAQAQPQRQSSPRKEVKLTTTPLRFALLVTAGFFVIALIGMLTHEMWRDEHQAWLVARDANSLSQLLDNMNYEGNPAFWHFFLFLITRVTHDPVYMQAFHLLIATSFIFIFNRYAPLSNLHKILFSLGYFPLYEYALISRSYALGILLVFGVCALYKNRLKKYILIGVLLALLANVTIYAVVIAGSIAGILVLDYFLYQQKNGKALMQLSAGMLIFALGVGFSLYQIWPEKDNSFPAPYAESLFEFARWWQVASKLFTTYLYVPQIQEQFWNTNLYYKESGVIAAGSFSGWLSQNPSYLWAWVLMQIILFASGVIIFLRKPLILLLYCGTTLGLFSVYYYTALLHSRYCGYLLIALVTCYWLAEYYPENKYPSGVKNSLSNLGKRISKSFLTIVLSVNVLGAMVAYSMDLQYKFSTSKIAADYIKQNRLDSLPVVGITDFTASPLSTYLDKKLYYLQMKDTGSFIIWSNKRQDQMTFEQSVAEMAAYMNRGNPRVLWVKNSAPQVSLDGKNNQDMEKAILMDSLKIDLLQRVDGGIVNDEKYYIYLVQKVDPARVDQSYIRISMMTN
jgi:hypothetical protein